MTSYNTQEKWMTTPDGHELYTKSWSPNGPAKARLLFVHGFSDHCNCYDFFFHTLVDQGIQVYAYDQRGFGRSVHSPSQRGRTGPTSQVLADLTFIIDILLPRKPTKDASSPPVSTSKSSTASTAPPIFLMGHSMGGGEVLTYLSTGPRETLSRIRGFLLESPLVALPPASAPSRFTVILGSLASRVFPHRQLVSKLDPKFMSRDPDVCRAWHEDELCHDTGTLEGLAAMLARSEDLVAGRAVVKEGLGEGGQTRLWLGHGTGDAVVSFDASKKWFESSLKEVKDKEFRAYEGWFHKLHDEPGQDKVRFTMDVAGWILARCGNDGRSTGEATTSESLEAKPKL